METFAERLAWARREAGFKTAQSAAEQFGWNANTYKSHDNGLRGAERGPNEATVRKYARAFGVDWVWLRTGEGKMPARKGLVSSFDPDASDDPHDSEAQPSVSRFPPDAIKELAARAGMGAGELAVSVNNLKSEGDYQRDSFTDDYWRLPASYVRDTLSSRVSDLLVITCKGDSMEPTLSAGDRVIANTFERTPTVDGIYAILNGVEEVVVKRLAIVGRDPPRLKVISDNPSTPPEEFAWDQVPIVGRVVAGLKLF